MNEQEIQRTIERIENELPVDRETFQAVHFAGELAPHVFAETDREARCEDCDLVVRFRDPEAEARRDQIARCLAAIVHAADLADADELEKIQAAVEAAVVSASAQAHLVNRAFYRQENWKPEPGRSEWSEELYRNETP